MQSLSAQPAVQPEAVAASLVAAVHGSVSGQTETVLGLGDLLQDGLGVACPDAAQSGCVSRGGSKGQFPLRPAQLESQIKRRPAVSRILRRGRRHGQAPFQETYGFGPGRSLTAVARFADACLHSV